jgi:hypothetical protein
MAVSMGAKLRALVIENAPAPAQSWREDYLAETRRRGDAEIAEFRMGIQKGFCDFFSLRSSRLREKLTVFDLRTSRRLPKTFLGLLRSSMVAVSNSRGDQPCRSEVFCAG